MIDKSFDLLLLRYGYLVKLGHDLRL
jgi:hypothetical protein